MNTFTQPIYKASLFLIAALFFYSCSQEKEELVVEENVNEYLPLTIGKSITYRLDSTVFTKNGSIIEIHKYQVKHTVLSGIKDNLGNKTYIIQRLINNENGTGPWLQNGNYTITPSANSITTINDNLRVVVLQGPLNLNFSWKGNAAIPLFPYSASFNTDLAGTEMKDWDFIYSKHRNDSYEGHQYNDVWTVTQSDYILNMPPISSQDYSVKEVSVEKYSRNIGLVFKDYQLYEYQKQQYKGFGITMWMIEHS